MALPQTPTAPESDKRRNTFNANSPCSQVMGHLHFVESSQEVAQADNLQPIYSEMFK